MDSRFPRFQPSDSSLGANTRECSPANMHSNSRPTSRSNNSNAPAYSGPPAYSESVEDLSAAAADSYNDRAEDMQREGREATAATMRLLPTSGADDGFSTVSVNLGVGSAASAASAHASSSSPSSNFVHSSSSASTGAGPSGTGDGSAFSYSSTTAKVGARPPLPTRGLARSGVPSRRPRLSRRMDVVVEAQSDVCGSGIRRLEQNKAQVKTSAPARPKLSSSSTSQMTKAEAEVVELLEDIKLPPSKRPSAAHVTTSRTSRKRTGTLRFVPQHVTFIEDHHDKQQQLPKNSKSSLYTSDRPMPSGPPRQNPYPTYSHSRNPSILNDATDLPPLATNTPPHMRQYKPGSPIRQPSPTRPWTPSRGAADWPRPPATNSVYEPPELNGSPRPGTPSSRYGGSPKRPLPPAPLFAGGRASMAMDDDIATSIPINDDDATLPLDADGDDVFGGRGLQSRDSFNSQDTYTEEYRPKYADEDEEGEVEYATMPNGVQVRRGARDPEMATKEVPLIDGKLILECKIPTILYSFLPRRDDDEFTHMRYTAVTCDPDDFVDSGYKLRQNIGVERETELLICVTMYNENEIDFTRTMHGIMRNIAHFCSRTKSRTWGKDGWQKITVCIISDGRRKAHPRTLDALAAMGVYQSGIAKNIVNKREVQAHVYEYTTQVSLDADLKFKGAEKGIVPCQIIYCLKEKNLKKLNSHRWFFNAFGRALNPNVCILLDVGTKPGSKSLYHLWKAFDTDSTVAGAAGEIRAGKGKGWLGLLNPLVASQNFEYKMSNILDKPLESVFGYITVLPGALSAYRYHALQNDETGHGPLSQYFKGETLHGQDADVFTANMYLAEDRILCWELVAKKGEKWVLKYVKSAVGETDVPDAVPEFVSQRRRWLNGAFFAAVYSLLHFRQIWYTEHSIMRKVLLHVEFIYQFVNLLFTYFSLANFYLTFYFIAGSLADPRLDPFGHSIGKYIFYILRYTTVLLICVQFILSMGNRPQGARRMFLWSMVSYCVIMAYTTFASLYIVFRQLSDPDSTMHIGNNVFTNLIVSTASTVGLYFLMSFLYLDPWHMFTSSAQYFALLPSYICTLQVYAFCNAHDVTWGTKGDNITSTDLGAAKAIAGGLAVELDMPKEQLDIDSGYDEALRNLRDRVESPAAPVPESQLQGDYYRAVRTYMVVVWMVANAVVAMAISEAYQSTHIEQNFYLAFILWSVAAVAIFRALGSSAFGVLNIVKAVAEGKLRYRAAALWRGRGVDSSASGGSSSSGGGGRRGRWGGGGGGGSSFSAGSSGAASVGSWISGKLSVISPSSVSSVFSKG